MKYKLFLLILGVFFISLISAIYPGECDNVSFPNAEPVNFTLISGDSQILNNFNWIKNGTNITYCFNQSSIIGNFTFKWENTEEVTVNSGGSGGYKTPPKAIIPNETNESIIPEVPIVEEPEEPPQIPETKTYLVPLIILTISLILAIGLIYYTLLKRN